MLASGMFLNTGEVLWKPVIAGALITFVYYTALHSVFSSNEWKNFVISSVLLSVVGLTYLLEIKTDQLQQPMVKTRLFFFISALLIALLYVSPVVLRRFRIHLREIPFIKAPVIAFCWTIFTCFLPVLSGEPIVDYMIIISRFLMILPIAILFDLMDMPEDSGKIRTIPLFIGKVSTKLLCAIMFVLSDLLLFFHGSSSWPLLISPLALGIIAFVRPPTTVQKSLILDGLTVIYFPLIYWL